MDIHPCDEAVIHTNDDASECKRSAVQRGYYIDNYIGCFVKNPDRKAPEINRGYYARVKGVETLVEKFLNVSPCLESYECKNLPLQKTDKGQVQLINLGCGFDTLFFRLVEQGHQFLRFVEVDFPTVTARKCYQIKRNKVLLEKVHSEGNK